MKEVCFMYTNTDFQNLVQKTKELKLNKISDILQQISNFYLKLNRTFDRCTARYKNAVSSILDQFPIKVSEGLDGKIIFSIAGKQIFEEEKLVTALNGYIDKFESIDYLEFLSEEKRNVVFVGPNGCGKTTLLRKLKQDTQGANIQYFAADRVLLVNDNFNPKRAYDTFIQDFNENYQNSTNIENSLQGSYIIKQFDYFINLLERERTEEKEKGITNGTTEQIICKWHELVKDRELFFEHGLCIRPEGGNKYPLKYMSSGEKSILYFLIGILLQRESDIYFIDEPENNLNPAIVSKLWNFIERERPNSIFVYLTHDSDFVASRVNSKIYWIEEYDGQRWKWQQLKENKDLPQELMIELVGSREPILFCESENEYKYDSKLYKLMFPEFKVVTSGGCSQVCTFTKAYKTTGLPNNVYGIIDCDYKMDDYLASMSKDRIFYVPFFEVENLLISEDILKAMVNRYSKVNNKEIVISSIKSKILELFVSQKDKWVAKHVAFDLRDRFDYRGKIKPIETLDQLKALYKAERKSDDEIDAMASRYNNLHSDLVKKNNYNEILRHIDCKGFLRQYNHLFEFEDDIKYEHQVFSLFNSDEGEMLLLNIRVKYLSEIKP